MTQLAVYTGFLWCLISTGCASTSSPTTTTIAGPTAQHKCSSYVREDVSPDTALRLGHATNLIEYENIWKADHPGATSGSVSGSEVRAVIHGKLAEVQACYAPVVDQAADGGGRVVVRFVIDERGTVASAHIGSNSFGSPEVGCCVVEHVGRWTFLPSNGGAFAVVEYPFTVKVSHTTTR